MTWTLGASRAHNLGHLSVLRTLIMHLIYCHCYWVTSYLIADSPRKLPGNTLQSRSKPWNLEEVKNNIL